MEGLLSIAVYVVVIVLVIAAKKKRVTRINLNNNPGAMPHQHKPSNVYETYNRKSSRNDSGAMPHKHEKNHYTSMADASKLPKGYILLNGEPVRVADLEGK